MRRLPYGTPHPLVTELREERRAAGLGQRKVPGVDHTTVGLWERGVTIPTVESLIAYAAGLGYEVVIEDDAD